MQKCRSRNSPLVHHIVTESASGLSFERPIFQSMKGQFAGFAAPTRDAE
jgi:hypothetical protein